MMLALSAAPPLFGQFMAGFLNDASSVGKRVRKACQIIALGSLAVAFMSVSAWTWISALNSTFILSVYTVIICGRMLQRDKAAMYLMIGVSWFIAGASTLILGLFALMSFESISTQVGTALEAIFLSVALAQRMRNLKDDKESAQTLAIDNLHRADRLKDEFLANTSHELRTPLNGMIGLAEAILSDPTVTLSSEHRRHVGMIISSGRRLTHLVNDLLDVSKMREGQLVLSPRAVDIHATAHVVLTLLKPLARDKALELKNTVADTMPPVWADEGRLQQILHNLVGNAIKFTPKGSVTVAASWTSSQAVITVTDTGIGIPEDRQSTIFEAFNQGDGSISREFGGTGLGLSVAKKLARLHGGDLTVTSRAGEGACFSITLPLADAAQAKPIPVVSSLPDTVMVDEAVTYDAEPVPGGHEASVGTASARILVVDDEPVNREVLRAQLRAAGYEVAEAANGREALSVLLAPGSAPMDLVLLDVMMPKLSGFEVCKTLRNTFAPEDLPILFLTAKVQGEDVVTGLSVGGNDYLAKPFSREELLARIQVHLGLLQAHRTLRDQHEQLETVHRHLVQQEKMAQLGLLSAGVAHEINNPNNFVNVSAQNVEQRLRELQGFIDELMADDADPELSESFRQRFTTLYNQLNLVKDGSSRISTIVKSMRAASRGESGEAQLFDPVEGLLATVQLVKASWKDRVEFDTSQLLTHGWVSGHASQLNQVFTNLMINACHAIEERQAGESLQGTIRFASRAEGAEIIIEIEDNGCGMPDHVRERLFEPFFTTKGADRGTGLGMGICRAIIDEHRGRIDVDSAPGKGACFTVILPTAE